ncbi:MAG: DUF1919 domain-containing protein [Duncaniella sp.]|nr:DUF1919 domain-containing protein [Duncaniella sp.]
MKIKGSWIFNAVKPIYTKIVNIICDTRRKPLLTPLKKCLLDLYCDYKAKADDLNGFSIISSNCFAGRIMQDFDMEYNSPTLGLYFMYPDYIEFLKNLRYYLSEAKIEFVEHSKYPIGDERRAAWSHWYPIGLLDGKVEIHFLHYYSEKEASEKWYRRASRVNFNRLLIVGMQQNLCTESDIREFDALTYENKIMFTTKQLPLKSTEYISEFSGKDCVGDPYRKGHVFYKHLISHFQQ